jgi:hypothetical protein
MLSHVTGGDAGVHSSPNYGGTGIARDVRRMDLRSKSLGKNGSHDKVYF